ncbi:MAG: tetratricopeptide repeat protein [Candidatus Omnitrophica bacterium]|nr:tetratricopeptide repeat protein [Candidatus Omnitrophota bacterium]
MDSPSARRIAWWLPPILLSLATAWAYHNSLHGPFILDDTRWIIDNPQVRSLWRIADPHVAAPLAKSVAGRPLLTLSLALNYALGGTSVVGYHFVNVLAHLAAGLLLFGIIRRTLRSAAIALAAALLWLLHPLQTSSVTYVIQRAEVLMGLCYLATLYGVIRSAASPRPKRWYAVSIAACAAGMAVKAVMVTAPLMILLYDGVFLSGSVREAWRRRRPVYLGLGATWIWLAALVITAQHGVTTPTVASAQQASPFAYGATQLGVILHYLRLAIWPAGLCIDYDWPMAATAADIIPPLAMVAVLLAATVWALMYHPRMGYLGAWWFVILAPTSSIIPLADLVFEHRLYLPLAAVVLLIVLGADAIMRRMIPVVGARRALAVLLVGSAALGLGIATLHRNAVYQTEESIWRDAVAKQPRNGRAHNNVGIALGKQGRYDEAAEHFLIALSRDPANTQLYNNLGIVRSRQGRSDEAIRWYQKALQQDPDDPSVRNNLAVLLAKQGRFDDALAQYRAALRVNPDDVEARKNYDELTRWLAAQRPSGPTTP